MAKARKYISPEYRLGYTSGYTAAYRKAKKKMESANGVRSKAKWIIKNGDWYCSKCDTKCDQAHYDFCCKCGSEMDSEEED